MKNILVVGSGRSSSSLISYLIKNAAANDWKITVGDIKEGAAQEKIGSSTVAKAISFIIEDVEASVISITRADVVISMVPAHLHEQVAKICLAQKKHLLTASYVSEPMKNFDREAKKNGLLFLNECGLDPGIDHMSAMQAIEKIKSSGGELTSFESYTGGLIAPETDRENPWRYKFTWNPRNVVLAGQGTAKFLQNGQFKYIPYQQLFLRHTPISVPDVGMFEGYANRDSLHYKEAYGLQNCQSILRGTLRNVGYCSAWNILVQLGCCDDSYSMEEVHAMTHRDFIASFLNEENCEEAIARRFSISSTGEEMKRLRWSGFFTDEKIGLDHGTPAQILEHILAKKWKLAAGDKDFIVMWHRFNYLQQGKAKEMQSWITATGNDENQTAIAKTVGLPLAIACKLLIQGKITSKGVVVPLRKEFYEPILRELKELGIQLHETAID